MLRLEQAELAELAGVSQMTVKRFEATSGPLKGRQENIFSVVREMEHRGIEFLRDADAQGQEVGVGVRFAPDPHAEMRKLILGVVVDAAGMALTTADLNNHDPTYLADHLTRHMPKWLSHFMPSRLRPPAAFENPEVSELVDETTDSHAGARLRGEDRNQWLARLKREGLPAPKSKRTDAPRRISNNDLVRRISDDDGSE